MHRNLHSPTKLTEFARDFEVEPETFLTKFVNKLTNAYNSGYNSINIAQQSSTNGQQVENQSNDPAIIFSRGGSSSSLNQSQQNFAEQKSSSTSSTAGNCNEFLVDTPMNRSEEYDSEIPDERTQQNVIQRISNLMALKNNNLGSYKNSELQRFWMPDSKSKECYECSAKFSTFRRKHHCRLCGQIFCSKCCNQVVPGKIINCSGDLKVCTYCSKIVLSYLKSSDLNSDLKSDLQALQQDLANKLSVNDINHILDPPALQHRKISVGYQEERFVTNPKNALLNADRKAILQQSKSLKSIHFEMCGSLPNVNRGDDLISYLINSFKSSNKIQAIAILKAMIEAEFILPVYQESEEDSFADFDENFYYKLVRVDDMRQSSGSFQLDLNIDTNSALLTRPSIELNEDVSLPSSQDKSFGFSTTKEFEQQNSLLSTAAVKPLLEAFCEHEDLLLTQLLRNENLDQSWSKILLQICAKVANCIRPEMCGLELMDIRNVVNFKKVPGGTRVESKIIGGVVFSKNVVHKDMATSIENPKVLLLNCAIVYQRVEGKFISIESLLLQEKEYLRNVAARILSLKPNVVLVHKNVSGIAQDMLRDFGITLVLDVKLSVLDRLSRCLNCDIVTSIDSNIGRPKLGTCDRFYIQNFENQKTLMFFEIPSSPRGCCVLLRGGINNELVKVKRVALMLLFARYNWRLELSFLLDEFARPPSPKPNIFDSKDHSPSKLEDNKNFLQRPKSDENSIRELSPKKDPKSVKSERKNEEKIVNKENVHDFTDPLRAPDHSLSAFNPETSVEFAVETPYDNRFRTALSSTALSISPFVGFPLPFLETEQGQKCVLRAFYPNELYYSKQWSTNPEKPVFNEPIPGEDKIVKMIQSHPFVNHKITTAIDNREMQSLLASFRASGGRLIKTTQMKQLSKNQDSNAIQSGKLDEEMFTKDALDLKNHQRLPVLFCSYYYNAKAPSSFCAQPSLLNMIFYGQNDIMLGQFLEHYCFRSSYICSSCNLPMLNHIRRYVHSMGCVQVKLNEDLSMQISDQILMTSWCSICQEMTPSVPMSKVTWCLSFAKYLELRFHSHAYKRRAVDMNNSTENTNEAQEFEQSKMSCCHSLHRDHVQYFSFNGIVASFTYTQIEVWEIALPSLILTLKNPRLVDTNVVLEDIKNFALKGYEVYGKIHEKLIQISNDDEMSMVPSLKTMLSHNQQAFRDKVTNVQTLLTEKNVNAYEITDAMLLVKRILAESIELWSPRLHEAAIQSRTNHNNSKIEPSNDIDSAIICTEDLRHDVESGQTVGQDDNKLGNSDQENKDHNIGRRESSNSETNDESVPNKQTVDGVPPPSDKKSVKQLLRELLASDKNTFFLQSPIPTNEHYCLPLGRFPIVVYDQDLSSVIAYSLASCDYKKALINMQSGYTSDSTGCGNSPKVKRKSQDGLVDGDDREPTKESDKKNKSTQHIEINFQDLTTQFTCKIYFAQEFDTMRANFIRPPKMDKLTKDQQESDKNKLKNTHPLQNTFELDARSKSPGNLDRKSSSNSLTTNTYKDGTIGPDSEEIQNAFVRSLCESVKWEARGGKSGSKFCKTLDDRFVLKEMTKQDVAIFENFAPNYFVYVNQCLQVNQPTLLVKIFGVFKVTIKKKESVCEKSLLIMENLFYNSDISNKFDLKGSDRNRLVDPTNQNGEIVLLDENLIQMSWSKPLYLLSHSKTILREAIIRDASFLEKNDVMDYSLLVGLNCTDRILVLGIIDYIRTFTLDKRIESIVKQTGLLGGQGKLPTVVSPKLYRQRFTEAMERYFLTVPDRWEGLGKK